MNKLEFKIIWQKLIFFVLNPIIIELNKLNERVARLE
jgi:hypothetical protein